VSDSFFYSIMCVYCQLQMQFITVSLQKHNSSTIPWHSSRNRIRSTLNHDLRLYVWRAVRAQTIADIVVMKLVCTCVCVTAAYHDTVEQTGECLYRCHPHCRLRRELLVNTDWRGIRCICRNASNWSAFNTTVLQAQKLSAIPMMGTLCEIWG